MLISMVLNWLYLLYSVSALLLYLIHFRLPSVYISVWSRSPAEIKIKSFWRIDPAKDTEPEASARDGRLEAAFGVRHPRVHGPMRGGG